MTVETQLRSAMAEAVAPVITDTDLLVATARRRGLGIRRRRQALGAVGVAAALAVVLVAPTYVAGDGRTDVGPAAAVRVGTEPVPFDTSQTSQTTGRSTAAALLYAVGLEASGTAADVRGQGGDESGPATYAVFRFTPDGRAPAADVGVNVQRFGGTQRKPGDPGGRLARCDSRMEHCTTTTLPDGSRLLTYEQRSNYGDHRGILRVVDLYRPDHVRVVAYASNGLDVTERDEQIAQAQPVLSTEQLVAVVTQPWWGPRLPTYFAEQGDHLETYTQIGHEDPVATATPAKP